MASNCGGAINCLMHVFSGVNGYGSCYIMIMRFQYLFIIFLTLSNTVMASSPLTGDQFDKLLEQAQFIIATWHGVLAALIFGLSMFLYRRIVHNEESSKKDTQELDRYARHEVRELNAGIRSSLEIVMGQSRAFVNGQIEYWRTRVDCLTR